VLESFLWRTPLGLKTFRMDAAKAAITAPLARNQGLYNAFLAARLVWSLLGSEPLGRPIATFFLGCVALAGLVGALTVSPRIFLIQTIPALLWAGSCGRYPTRFREMIGTRTVGLRGCRFFISRSIWRTIGAAK